MAEGGNMDSPVKSNPFVQFSVLSNFIASPKVLLDPADDRSLGVRPAHSWGNGPDGLLNVNYRNASVSYFLGLDGNFSTPPSLLAGDRNLRHRGFSSCSSGVWPAGNLGPRDSWITTWTNAVHGLSGNVLSYDGTVREVDNAALREAIFPSSEVYNFHILLPF
jgi:hypothetical protein